MSFAQNRPKSDQKTILDAFREHKYLKPKPVNNPSIPRGGSIISPKPPELKTYYTICDNGGRRIPSYYLGGRRVNALGLALTDTDRQAIDKFSCKGCRNFRCKPSMFSCHSTAQSETRHIPGRPKKVFPKPSNYYQGPLPPAPISVQYSDNQYGQLEDEYYLDDY